MTGKRHGSGPARQLNPTHLSIIVRQLLPHLTFSSRNPTWRLEIRRLGSGLGPPGSVVHDTGCFDDAQLVRRSPAPPRRRRASHLCQGATGHKVNHELIERSTAQDAASPESPATASDGGTLSAPFPAAIARSSTMPVPSVTKGMSSLLALKGRPRMVRQNDDRKVERWVRSPPRPVHAG